MAGETTAEARDILSEHGVGVIDRSGNAHLELPGRPFYIEAKRPRDGEPRDPEAVTRLTGKAGVAAQALLLQPGRESEGSRSSGRG